MPSSPWWRHFPRVESRKCCSMPVGASPELTVGTIIKLAGKPDRTRRILDSEWHLHRYEFVYIVETSAQNNFRPYWFAAQLTVVGSGGDR
ncbi:hypothetical protein [Rhodopirellula sp. SWK7]|uniref:hypothetical protein n=1 Tax=Rhodopirellula sp. SWK7 TaxID=595460 RepID=UPI0011818236|nr:hypothetical protein [Rhodopirellula sp. SWK7]